MIRPTKRFPYRCSIDKIADGLDIIGNVEIVEPGDEASSRVFVGGHVAQETGR